MATTNNRAFSAMPSGIFDKFSKRAKFVAGPVSIITPGPGLFSSVRQPSTVSRSRATESAVSER